MPSAGLTVTSCAQGQLHLDFCLDGCDRELDRRAASTLSHCWIRRGRSRERLSTPQALLPIRVGTPTNNIPGTGLILGSALAAFSFTRAGWSLTPIRRKSIRLGVRVGSHDKWCSPGLNGLYRRFTRCKEFLVLGFKLIGNRGLSCSAVDSYICLTFLCTDSPSKMRLYLNA